jgi:trigger factor
MKTTVDKIDETTITLTVEVDAERVKKAFNKAAKELSKEIQIKGFRPGKAPRRLIEQRLGTGALAQEALEPSINEYYVEALEETELAPVAFPKIDPESIVFSEEDGCTFVATISVRPEFEAPAHEGISVQFPVWDVDEAVIDTEIASLRERFAEVDVVERAAATGDFVTIDLTFTVEGAEMGDQAVEDAMYEIGSEGVTPKLDDELVGAIAGAVIVYTDALPEEFPEHAGKDAEFTVTVKDVRSKTLPALDDDFALTASEFDTLDELKDSIRTQQTRQTVTQAQHDARSRVLEAYLALIEIPLPDAMVESEVESRVGRVEQQAAQYAATAREQSLGAVKAQLVLDQLAEQLGLEVDDADVNQEIFRHAQTNNVSPQQIAEVIQQQGTIGALVGDILRRKSIDAIIDAATLDGGPDDATLIRLGLLPDPDAVVPEGAQKLIDEAVAQAEADIIANTVPVDEVEGASSDDSADADASSEDE